MKAQNSQASGDQKPSGAESQKPESETTRLTLLVVRDEDDKPVADAHVVVRFLVGRFLRPAKKTSWEAKTNRKGFVVLDDVPTGQVQVQVIAKGYQTYGEKHDLSRAEEQLTLRLKPPRGQVSAY